MATLSYYDIDHFFSILHSITKNLNHLFFHFSCLEFPTETHLSIYQMANPSSIPPAEIALTGPMNNLFELPDKRMGDDQGAISIWQNSSYCPRTPACIQFDLKNQMTIKVRFKIYTPTAVDINIPSQSTDKVGAGKKPAKSIKLNLINPKKIKGKYFEIKSCLFGKSLNEFKIIYLAGMKNIVLNCNFLPKLKWKTTDGRLKQALESVVQWQAFVGALEKSIKKEGVVVIKNKDVEVQSIKENTESDTDSDLHIMANRIFSQAGISGYAGGDGCVLSVPWNPAFKYCLTYAAAWIWAKGIMAKIATQHPPPNTCKFNQEIKKVICMQLQGHPQKLKAVKAPSTSSQRSTRVSKSSVKVDSKPNLKNLNNKRCINLTKPFEPGKSIDDPMCLLSDTESKNSDESAIEILTSHHSVQMDWFLANCKIPYEDDQTCYLLKQAGIIPWTNLISSVQMKELALTTKGIERQIAPHLMDEAKAHYYTDYTVPIFAIKHQMMSIKAQKMLPKLKAS
ncbi:hypothetical protein DFH28DRAFT_1095047 [Melampsora americana]|nr:hypothetical protein DFH28DRAFT_1095047 [Melampsora americana]